MTTPTTVSVRLQLRADTAANWTSANPTLLANELGRETDTGKIKIGDGSTAWSSLAYQAWATLPIAVASGGTGQTSYTNGQLLIGNTTGNTLTKATLTAGSGIAITNGTGSITVAASGISDAQIAADAEIAVSKLADGTARQLLQTDAAGTGVEWASNIDIPGTLDVTSAATFDSTIGASAGTASLPSITFTGDLNTGIYSPGADQVAISTNGTGRLFITSAGLIGIGQSSPGSALDVAGEIRIYPTSGAANLRFGSGGAEKGKVAIDSSSNYTVETAGSERLRITSAGLVGVGTSSPVDKLHVDGRIAVSTDSSTPTTGEAFFYKNASGAVMSGFGATIETGGAGSRQARVSVDSSGRVGIGTTDARGVLRLAGSSANAFPNNGGLLWLTDTNAATDYKNWSVSSINGDFGVARASDAFNTGQNAYKITGSATQGYVGEHIWYTNNSSERVRIDNSGRLLVGTSTDLTVAPGIAEKLQVAGTGYTSSSIYNFANSAAADRPFLNFARSRGTSVGSHVIVNNNDWLGTIDFLGSDGTNFEIGARINAEVDSTPGANDMPGRLVFSTTADGASSPTERMRITSTGAALIGSTGVSDGEKLKVENSGAGNSAAYFVYSSSDDRAVVMSYHAGSTGVTSRKHYEFRNSGGNAVGSISADGTATAYNTSSDYRLKENVASVTDGIARLQQLKPSRFNFIADPDRTVDGFIAHEVQAVVPEAIVGEKDAVDADGSPIYQGIDQSKLVPLLTAALQEAVAKIESLEARLTAAGI